METVLFINLINTDKGQIMTTILSQLGIKVIHINEVSNHKALGYILDLDGFQPDELEEKQAIDQEMIIFHNFSEEQVQIVMDVFKSANVPYIPLKATTTPNNIEWSPVNIISRSSKRS